MAGCSGTALAVLVLSCLQVFVFAMVFLMPGISLVIGFLSFSGIGLLMQLAGGGTFLPSVVAYAYLLVAVASLLAHVYCARAGSGNFTAWVWSVRVALNAVTMGVTLVTTVAVLALSIFAPTAFEAQLQADGMSDPAGGVQDARIAGCLGIVYTTTPFFLSMMHSSESFLMMCQT